AVKAEQRSDDMARALLLFNTPDDIAVTLNGAPVKKLPTVTIEGRTARLVPLGDAPLNTRDIIKRYMALLPARAEGFVRITPSVGMLRSEADSYLYTVPRSGMSRFLRLWPAPSVIDARTAGGIRVVTAGRVALSRLDIDIIANRVDLDIPPIEQGLITDLPARAVLITGFAAAPAVWVNGTPCAAAVGTVELDGQQAWVVPLGSDAVTLTEASRRVKDALAKLK
ncbi:MAG TPA: hypothetical protein PLP66_15705, partial [Phycisphaerae bacterium]|nr:hypothetical protein [Phycisphaerae bacterium]